MRGDSEHEQIPSLFRHVTRENARSDSGTVSNGHPRIGVAVWLLFVREGWSERITEDLLNGTKDTQEGVTA